MQPPVAAAKLAPASQSEMEVLLGKLDALEDKVDALEEKMNRLQERPASARMKTPALKKAGMDVRKSGVRPVAKKSKTRAASSGALWVLRSAKPGMAWVSKTGGDELRAVSIGDDLPGIGRVTAVAKDSSGRWSVNGTKGRISQ